MSRLLDIVGVGRDRLTDLDARVTIGTSIPFEARPDARWARHVTAPTYLYAVRDDSLTEPHDIEQMYALVNNEDKALHWIESTIRWDGYLEFQRRPQPVLDFLAAHMTVGRNR